ncbi:MAG: MarR family winged helix-turn-helix transcriptional regulator [Thermomicrobiales bacterium]
MTGNLEPTIPQPGEGKRGEEGYIGYLMRQAYSAVRLGIERALEDLEVTSPQFLVMTMVNAYPGLSSADVARLALLTPQTISLIVANLERSGRLTRVVSPTHGRVQRMELTDAGRDLLARCRVRTHQIEARLSASMPPELEPAIRHWLVELISLDLTVDKTAAD